MKKRIISIILSALMLLTALTSCKGDQIVTTEDVTVTEPADTQNGDEPDTPHEYRIGSDIPIEDYDAGAKSTEEVVYAYGKDSVFGLHRDAKEVNGDVVLPAECVGGVYPLVQMSDTDVTEYTFELTSQQDRVDVSWFTFYLGLRLNADHADPTVHSGVWIAMRNKSIGLRRGVWPETGYVKTECDFTAGVKIKVTDDPVSNVIKLYYGEDEKELATVKIDGKTIELYTPDKEGPALKDTVELPVIKGGFAHLWNHITDNDVIVKNFSFSSAKAVYSTDNNGIKNNTKDLFADTWYAYDDTGRTVSVTDVKPNGTKVGMFYFLWHESSNNRKPLYDHTKSYLEGGKDALWKTMVSGDLGFVHYWGEPYFGYYASDDEWVIRKHGTMLAEAGIDFIFFDATNGVLYQKCYETVMRVWSQMRKEGIDTPDVCFLMRGNDKTELSSLWNNLYSIGLYEDLWFRWNEKPVIMFTNSDNKLTSEQEEFFTVRYSWANEDDKWYKQTKGINCWAWGTMFPQKGGYIKTDVGKKLEQMVVMCGFWANGSYDTNAGRSYTYNKGEPVNLSVGDWDMGYGLFPQTSGLGLAYQEQFDRAISKAPELIMITGWNEWWAGRWEGGGAVGQKVGNEYFVSNNRKDKEYNYYVDNLNPEYSRDIEPMKGGFGDNYYYQTVINLRNYKGARKVESAFGQTSIDISGSGTQWLSVGPEYRDPSGDTMHRDHPSHVGGMTYTNDTGRNDIVTAKVSSDDTYLYFLVECTDAITDAEGSNWMNLLVKTDADQKNGWYGFDYIINRSRENGKADVERFKDGWNFEKAGDAEYGIDGKTMTVKVEKALIEYDGKSFDFKWADNSVDDGDIMGFIDKGDAAPDGRFCYHYTEEEYQPLVPDCLTEDMAVFKTNGYNAYINGKSTRLVKDNTEATLIASGYDFYLPRSVLVSLGIDCSGQTEYDHYGVVYVKGNDPVKNAGKTVTVTQEGLLIIADKEITDQNTLDTLYRTLY